MSRRTRKGESGPRTLCIDVGGTGIKTMVVSARGKPLTKRARTDTPRPATPQAVGAALKAIVPDPIRIEWDGASS